MNDEPVVVAPVVTPVVTSVEAHPFRTMVPQWWPVAIGIVSLFVMGGYQYASFKSDMQSLRDSATAEHTDEEQQLRLLRSQLREDESKINFLEGQVASGTVEKRSL